MDQSYDVVIVGAGPAGLGCARVLQELAIDHVVVERHEIGASFRRWPEGMRMITPSFPSNQFGLLDLNACVLNTSPAYSLQREHPTGPQYAAYLEAVAEYFGLAVETGVDVRDVYPRPQGGLVVETSRGPLRAGFVIWAAGEFQYPARRPFPGAEHCRHTATVRSWKALPGEHFLVIGGYESGVDAAVQLCRLGKRVTVLERKASLAPLTSDPSLTLSPFTLERLERAQATGRVEVVTGAEVVAVEGERRGWRVLTREGTVVSTSTQPLLATGFAGSLRVIAERFAWREDGFAQLTAEDESTLTPGLFVAGPLVRQQQAVFCFIYKFRQRFAVVANAIARRLGVDPAPLEHYRQRGMYLDDLSCCQEACAC
ncbi:MAG: monooxygenase [Dehalococcoidia bacterium]|nr:MAG: monooxygenase [Dehalococcoidia bacterium]